METININGTEYVKKSDIPEAAPAGNRAVIIADRGFIYCGNMTRNEDGSIVLAQAKNIRKWDKNGMGGLLSDPVAAGATLDPVAYPIEFPAGTVLQIVSVPESWGR